MSALSDLPPREIAALLMGLYLGIVLGGAITIFVLRNRVLSRDAIKQEGDEDER